MWQVGHRYTGWKTSELEQRTGANRSRVCAMQEQCKLIRGLRNNDFNRRSTIRTHKKAESFGQFTKKTCDLVARVAATSENSLVNTENTAQSSSMP